MQLGAARQAHSAHAPGAKVATTPLRFPMSCPSAVDTGLYSENPNKEGRDEQRTQSSVPPGSDFSALLPELVDAAHHDHDENDGEASNVRHCVCMQRTNECACSRMDACSRRVTTTASSAPNQVGSSYSVRRIIEQQASLSISFLHRSQGEGSGPLIGASASRLNCPLLCEVPGDI